MKGTLLALLLTPAPAHAGEPVHSPSNHTALWSPIGPDASRTVIARELALDPDEVRRALARGREAARYDLQPGTLIERSLPEVGVDYVTSDRQQITREADGWALTVTGDSSRRVEGGDRELVYAAALENLLVAYDGERLILSGIKQDDWDTTLPGLPRTQQAEVPLGALLPGPGAFHIGAVSERLDLGPTALADFPVPKVYALPVDVDGALDTERRGLVIYVRPAREGNTLTTRAAWVRMDLAPPQRDARARPPVDPSADTSVVATIPAVTRLPKINTDGGLYVDVTLEGGAGADDASLFPAVHGSVGFGGSFWTVEALARPLFIGGGALLHSRRRRAFDASIGIMAAMWDRRARPAVVARIGAGEEWMKIDFEALVAPNAYGGGAKVLVLHGAIARDTYVTGGAFLRATSYVPEPLSAPRTYGVHGTVGISLYVSQRISR